MDNQLELRVRNIPQGFMCWWSGNERAACYTIRLYIAKDIMEYNSRYGRQTVVGVGEYQQICQIEKDRTTLYHSFVNLAKIQTEQRSSQWFPSGLNYYVDVVAEDREGNVIANSEKKKVIID